MDYEIEARMRYVREDGDGADKHYHSWMTKDDDYTRIVAQAVRVLFDHPAVTGWRLSITSPEGETWTILADGSTDAIQQQGDAAGE